MTQKNQLAIIATFINSGNVLEPFDDERDVIALHEIKSSSTEPFIRLSVDSLNAYIKKFLSDSKIVVSSAHTCSRDSRSQSPLMIFIHTERSESSPDSLILVELQSALSMLLDLTQENSELFTETNDESYFDENKISYIFSLAEDFVKKHGGKVISKPFEIQIGLGSNHSSSIHGRIKDFANRNFQQSANEIFYAQVDGLKLSDMAIYLRLVDDDLKVKSAAPTTYKVEKPSHLKTAAHILTQGESIARIVSYRKLDKKGAQHLFIKDITSEKIDPAEFSLSLTK